MHTFFSLAPQELLEAKEKEASQPPASSTGSYVYGLEISSSTQSIVEINSSSTTTVNITQVINSGDKEKMKAALLRLVSTVYRVFVFVFYFRS